MCRRLIKAGNKNTLIFDTETTGVPKNYWKDWNECYAVQIAYIIINSDYKILKQYSTLIKDDKHPSLPEPLLIHHITEEMRNEKGILINDFFDIFKKDINDFDVKNIVSHSSYFDIGLLYHEAIRNNYNVSFMKNLTIYDTKLSPIYTKTAPQVNLSRCVEINELPINFVGTPHDALYDVYLCQALYRATEPKAIMRRVPMNVINMIFTPMDKAIFWQTTKYHKENKYTD